MWGLPQQGFATALLWSGIIAASGAQGIFTCIDSKGRRLTADRPIPECMDREQKELNSSGTVRRKIGPEPTAQERAEHEETNRKAIEDRSRSGEEKRRDAALVLRYPNPASHQRERKAALSVVEGMAATAGKHIHDLLGQRKKLETEAEFYQSEPAKLPARIKRQFDELDQNMAAQKRFMDEQEKEMKRISARFDEEAAKLNSLWNRQGAPVAARSAASASR